MADSAAPDQLLLAQSDRPSGTVLAIARHKMHSSRYLAGKSRFVVAWHALRDSRSGNRNFCPARRLQALVRRNRIHRRLAALGSISEQNNFYFLFHSDFALDYHLNLLRSRLDKRSFLSRCANIYHQAEHGDYFRGKHFLLPDLDCNARSL